MRLVHFADLHLGVESYGRLDPATGLSSRVADFLRSLDAVVDYAIQEDVDLVLFCGDAYRSPVPSPTYQREFARRIHRLSQARIPTLLLAGNHDVPRTLRRATSIEVFETLAVDRVTIAQQPAIFTIPTKAGPVQVIALPWIPRSDLLAREECQGKSLEEVERLLREKVSELLREHLYPKLEPHQPTILAAHVLVQGAAFGSERSAMLGYELGLLRSDLSDPRLDYVALGHIHKHQALGDSPPIIYAGSLERVDFGEEKEEKGFVVAEVERGKARWEFIPLPVRPFLTIQVRLTRAEDPMAQLAQAISQEVVRGKVVRLIIEALPEQEALMNLREVEALLSGASFTNIIKRVERKARPRLSLAGAKAVEEMTPLEALELYLKARSIPAERREALLKRAKEMLGPPGT